MENHVDKCARMILHASELENTLDFLPNSEEVKRILGSELVEQVQKVLSVHAQDMRMNALEELARVADRSHDPLL